jgi:hypothetical protein
MNDINMGVHTNFASRDLPLPNVHLLLRERDDILNSISAEAGAGLPLRLCFVAG